MFNITEASKMTGIGRRTISKWIKQGLIPTIRVFKPGPDDDVYLSERGITWLEEHAISSAYNKGGNSNTKKEKE